MKPAAIRASGNGAAAEVKLSTGSTGSGSTPGAGVEVQAGASPSDKRGPASLMGGVPVAAENRSLSGDQQYTYNTSDTLIPTPGMGC